MGLLDFLKKDRRENVGSKAPVQKQKVEKTDTAKPVKNEVKKQSLVTAKKKDTKNAFKVLLKPLITEKATMTGTYFFEVAKNTNKQEVKKAIQAVYGVSPIKVNIVNYGTRRVRWGKTAGNQKAWKKAIVYLKPGEKIEIYGN